MPSTTTTNDDNNHHHNNNKTLPSSNRGNLVQQDGLTYQTGFGNTFESECLPGALPVGRHNPRLVPYQLFTEQLSGTAFTAPRHENRRVWLYRIHPSVVVGDCCDCATEENASFFGGVDPAQCQTQVNPLRWKPLPQKDEKEDDFITGMRLMCTAGDPVVKSGLAIYVYACRQSMKKQSASNGNNNDKKVQKDRYFYNADGEMLIVPQTGSLQICTELGRLIVHPTEIVVIPRGIVFQVNLLGNPENNNATATATTTNNEARGYVLEVYASTSFQLPELGPIGSNGLANARDFYYPTAHCIMDRTEYYSTPCTICCKMHAKLYEKPSPHSPLNVVAWTGNYLPYKYPLQRFCAINSVTYDHLDPSIYTVLTCPSMCPGTALADFVLFPPRVLATDANTFRPPWFHRNTMSEYMGLISGSYDAKQGGGFVPGGASLHNCMTPHGPDAVTYHEAVAHDCAAPSVWQGGLAFMFETSLSLKVAPEALQDETWRDVQYTECSWQPLGEVDQFTGWDLLAQLQKEQENSEE